MAENGMQGKPSRRWNVSSLIATLIIANIPRLVYDIELLAIAAMRAFVSRHAAKVESSLRILIMVYLSWDNRLRTCH